MAKRTTAKRTPVSAKRQKRTLGERVAEKLVKYAGADAIYIGPWLLFRRIAGSTDAKHAVGWVRETIADAVDSELAAPKRASHKADGRPFLATQRR